ncbi:AAA family ATPase [Psychrosphaera sp. B3R10]|uniref:AAA family ATPase n=1 Tax=Psychrosphaera algicola TaxID=3023714 RepID=A0ABT5FFE3_9GAMM|nr:MULTISPECIES: AAA family ATPase [unclassified Psychrosphaera]MBU2882705.1 AAA family ATPase [Psychrosphaera sp. I2R16]MBU2989276.1 AAA family ATPase [Psychrosphaera sp. B3R10]MDC2889588.1 AAA family ATPase [Psychrosphaera sp. G1-22]MDO6718110.1 AAA family ATPase [Psychrosphaera sp. 1_MG-2023]
MYLYHFGMRELPFSLTPNTNFYFGLPSHNEAMQVLMTALKTGEGFIKVTGEVGTGKTLLCRKLLNEMPDAFEVAYLPNPCLSPEEIRYAFASELGIKGLTRINQQQLSQKIQLKLVELNQQGKGVVLVIDEAQTIPWESFEALRLFTNLETESRKLVQVVLFGQPELDEMLASERLRQLRQRITFSYKLRSLNIDEMNAYVKHRMVMAGYQGANVFTPNALKAVFKYSTGVPRLANIICHKALMLTYGEGDHSVDKKHIVAAANDTDGVIKSSRRNVWLLVFSVLLSCIAAVAIWQAPYLQGAN